MHTNQNDESFLKKARQRKRWKIFTVVTILALIIYKWDWLQVKLSAKPERTKEIIFVLDKTEPYSAEAGEWAKELILKELTDIRDENWNRDLDNATVKVILKYYVLEKNLNSNSTWWQESITLSRDGSRSRGLDC